METCRICKTPVSDAHYFTAREMMFGTKREHRYFQCPSCGCLQIENFELNPEVTYPTDYASFRNYERRRIYDDIKEAVIRYSVNRAMGGRSPGSRLLGNPRRSLGAHALKERVSKSGRILDVGSGDGALIHALYQLGYRHVTGIDPYLKEDIAFEDFCLLNKNLSQLNGAEKFDVIMMHHSFEHLTDPLETMQHVSRLLDRGGLCIIRIPVADSYAFETYGINWVQLDSPRHNFLHTNKSMQLLAEMSGLEIIAIEDDSNEFQFLGSEQYKNDIPLNSERSFYTPFYKKLFFNKKHMFKPGDVRRFARQAEALNKEGRGDQRIYLLVHAS